MMGWGWEGYGRRWIWTWGVIYQILLSAHCAILQLYSNIFSNPYLLLHPFYSYHNPILLFILWFISRLSYLLFLTTSIFWYLHHMITLLSFITMILDFYVSVKAVLNGVMSELQFKYDGVRMELQGSRLGFNVCVAPLYVRLSVLEFTEVGVGSELGSVKINLEDWS